jgi:microcin C transport system ATP-binding protein
MSGSQQSLLSIRDLSVSFVTAGRPVRAVDRVSLEIRQGETLALVGESGSGKTVTALSILKLLPSNAGRIEEGSIEFDGGEILGLDDDALRKIRGNRISMIFQEPLSSLNPLHNVARQIGEILEVHQGLSGSAARRRIVELLQKVGLAEAEKRLSAFPHELSGGERQRVMIAMSLANDPDLLIADEPTTALDVTIQAQILDLLKELKHDLGLSLLLITHDFGVVRKMADNVCIMRQGKIVERGATETVFASPNHEYTKELLAAEPSGTQQDRTTVTDPLFDVSDLKVWFPIKKGVLQRTVDHVKAVDGVSVQVQRGETVGVVGESGSGKTTLGLGLLRLISSEGGIVFDGRNIAQLGDREVRPLRSKMQIVFQDPFGSLSPRMSVAQIIEEGLKIHQPHQTIDQRRAIVDDALFDVGLERGMRDRYPHEFSGGQRQRISIARALALRPEFVLLDEPTSALDRSVQAQVINLLRDLQQKYGLTYLFVSHDLKVVRALANYLIVMKAGKIVEQGPASEVISRPREPYTKQLMAAAFDLSGEPTETRSGSVH